MYLYCYEHVVSGVYQPGNNIKLESSFQDLRWQKDGVDIDFDRQNGSKYHLGDFGCLWICEFSESDAGTYQGFTEDKYRSHSVSIGT